MRLRQLLEEKSDKFDIETENIDSSIIVFKAIAKDDAQTIAGSITVNEYTITDIKTEEDQNLKEVVYALLKNICKSADEHNKHVMIDKKTFKNSSFTRWFKEFGFHDAEDDLMKRKPGSFIPAMFL